MGPQGQQPAVSGEPPRLLLFAWFGHQRGGVYCTASLTKIPDYTRRTSPGTIVEGLTVRTIRLFSSDNAKFNLRKIVTSKSKSCLMGRMGAFYKFSK
jgi:hypothetical protein